jgi:glycerol uptake facilitator protein
MPPSAIGEFFGTFLLILFGNGVVAGALLTRSKAFGAGWIAITTGWGLAVFVGVVTAMSLGAPGELNPAVTVANLMLGSLTADVAIWHITAQMAGAILGASAVWLQYLPHWALTTDTVAKRSCFCNTPAIQNTGANFLSEVIATFALVFVALALGSANVAGDSPATNLGAVLVGALVWGIGLSLGGPTGYAINPARDLGPRLAHALLPIAGKGDSNWGYAAIPVLGPLFGGGVAALLWSALT